MMVLHVGPHKTATTYLQANFHAQRAALRRRGWLYPATGERVGVAHHDISDHREHLIAGQGSAHADLVRIVEASRKGLDVLLSSEGFRRWRPRHYEALRQIAQPHDLRLVYTLRDPVSVMYSLWAQAVKLGGTEDLPGWIERHRRKNERSRILNPLIEIEPMMRRGLPYSFLLYDEIVRRKLDIFSVFCEEILGVSGLEPQRKADANERLPIEMTEFIRLLSARSPHLTGGEALNIGESVRYLLSEEERRTIVETVRTDGAAARRTIAVSRETPELLALEERLLRALSAQMRPLPKGDRIFRSEPDSWTYYDGAALAATPAVAELLEFAARKTAPDALRLRLAHCAKRLLQGGRRLRKRLLPTQAI